MNLKSVLQPRLHQSFDRPDLAFLFLLARHDLRFRGDEYLLDLARRIAPAEAEGRGNILRPDKIRPEKQGERDDEKRPHYLLGRALSKAAG